MKTISGSFMLILVSTLALLPLFSSDYLLVKSVFGQAEVGEEARAVAEDVGEQARAAAEDVGEQARAAAEEAEQEARAAAEEAEQEARAAAEEAEEAEELEELEVLDESELMERITICHIPPGNLSAAVTIIIAQAALEAHLAHGDIEKRCEDVPKILETQVRGLEVANKMKQKGLMIAEKMQQRGLIILEKLQERGLAIAEKLSERGINIATKFGTQGGLDVAQEMSGLGIAAEMQKMGLDTAQSMALTGINIGTTISERETIAEVKSEVIIEELEQKVQKLENRIQLLLEKLEQGSYHLPENVEEDTQKRSLNVSFEGQIDETTESIVGSVFLENVATRPDVAKFKVTGGEIQIGDSVAYDVVFGKARIVKGPAQDVLIIIGQIMDSEENISTLRLTLKSGELKDDITKGFADFDLAPQSKISNKRIASGLGQVIEIQS